jgi:putative aldouronate transport system permease protein
MILLLLITLYPFLHVAFASLSDPFALTRHQGLILAPLGFDVSAYGMVMQNPMILSSYLNTILYVTVGTSLNILLTSLGAYVLSRRSFPFRGFLMFTVVFTMFFSGGLIPFYIQVSSLGLMNTRAALIVPTLISTYNLIVMRTYFAGIPDSLEESAYIDGANDFLVLFRIIIPVSTPIVAVMILFYGVGHWNSWFNAMLFLRNRALYPLQLVLREILIQNDTSNMITSASVGDKVPIGESVKYATIMVATLPILFVYPFLQKYFVKGIMIGSLKG